MRVFWIKQLMPWELITNNPKTSSERAVQCHLELSAATAPCIYTCYSSQHFTL